MVAFKDVMKVIALAESKNAPDAKKAIELWKEALLKSRVVSVN